MLCSSSSALLLKWVAWLVNNRWRRQISANKNRNSEGRNIVIHKQARISFLRLSTGFSCFSCTTYDIITSLIILHNTKKVRMQNISWLTNISKKFQFRAATVTKCAQHVFHGEMTEMIISLYGFWVQLLQYYLISL